MSHPILTAEQKRLLVLQATRLLDTEASESFDRLTRLTSDLFQVPVALVSLIDADRQWFKSKVGTELTQTRRHDAFCDHTIRQQSVLVVEDAGQHPLFRDNPLVAGEPHIRFYAGAPLITAGGHALGSLCIIDHQPRRFGPADQARLQDMAAVVMAQVELQRSAGRVDEVTQLPNRARLREDLRDLCVLCRGQRRLLVTFEMMPSDSLLATTRALGAAVADQMAFDMGMRLAALLGEGCTVYHTSLGRFSTLLPADRLEEREQQVADLVLLMRAPLETCGIVMEAEASAGMVVVDLVPEAALDGPRKAMTALHVAAQQGLPMAMYETAADARHRHAHRLLREAPAALKSGQFRLVYQPKLDVASGTCSGAEALLRWQHPELGAIPPGEFIPAIENTILVHEVTRWVLEQAVAQSAAWRAHGIDLRLAVNVTARNLQRPGFPEELRAIARRYSVKPARIQVECTESMALDAGANAGLRQVRDMGFSVALDDFGSGYSNLACLPMLPADVLKLDQSLVRPIVTDPQAWTLLQSLVSLGKAMGFRMVAEGVEDAAVFEKVVSTGCDAIQGYHYARPLEAADIPAFVQTCVPFL